MFQQSLQVAISSLERLRHLRLVHAGLALDATLSGLMAASGQMAATLARGVNLEPCKKLLNAAKNSTGSSKYGKAPDSNAVTGQWSSARRVDLPS